jgi:glycolate oxidase
MLKPSVIQQLLTIVGPEHLITTSPEMMPYACDATQQESLPCAVVRPGTSQQVSEILAAANRNRVPVIPRGAGTGMSGGSVPVQGGIVLSLERMNRIIEIDEENLIAVVEPGVITGTLQLAVELRGLFYPPDPASHDTSTLGGNVAECAGGLRAVKYGVTKDYVLALEVVLPTGEIIHTGARTMKSVAGYDLTKLFVGSEGTLGIVTKITLKLLPLPETIRTLSAFFTSMQDAVQAVADIIKSKIVPRALELVDHSALKAVENYLSQDVSGGAAALLLVEVDGTMETVERESARIEALLRSKAIRVETAGNDQERERIWKVRRSISPALKTLNLKKVNEDIVVPRSKILDILREIDSISKRYGFLIVNFGHAGDGNIHTNVMVKEEDLPRAYEAVREIFAATIRLGGSITGEHGVGLTKAAFLPMELGPETIGAMLRIKRALDPNGILNPGKIFV